MNTKFCLSLLTLTSVVVSTQPANAQTYQPTNRTPVADSTLGTQVSGNGNNFNITGGVNKGQTLFHSFTDFSVPTNGQANFTNPVGNRDIITRVTGNVFSDINGTVNSNGANFFLINPNGIVFGTNTRLNVGKAFVGSTANSIDLVDAGGRTITFGTNASGDAPLLSVAPNVLFDVSRLNMGGGNGQISNFGTLQTNNPSQYIGLVGGNVKLDGGQINAPGGRVELGGLSAVGTVALGVDVNNLTAQFPTNVARGDISLTNGARVSVAGDGGGDIAISARNLEILGGSVVRGGIETGLGTPEAVAGDIKLNATGEIAIVGSNSLISNNVRLNSTGNGGNITVDAGSFSLRDGAILQSSTYGAGKAGSVTMTAKDAVSLSSNAYLLSTVESGGMGKGGNIDIKAASLSLQDAGQLGTFTRGASTTQPAGKGDAGNITVKVTGAIDIAGTKGGFPSAILSYVDPITVGNAGNISIDAGSFSLRDGAQISASTYGKGDAGKITIDAKENLSLDNGSSIFSNIFSQAEGNSQGITISVKDLNLLNSSLIATNNLGGKGNAGNIDINATGDITISGNTNFSILAAQPLNYISSISSGTNGKGNTGKITIVAKGNLSLDNRGIIFSNISTQGEGNSNGISIISKNLTLSNNGDIITDNLGGKGNAGNIDINTTGDITINGYNYAASISSGTSGQGDTGKITIDAQGNISLNNQAFINSNILSKAEGNSKGISISAKNLSVFNNSGIFTDNNGGQGKAGNIDIKTNGDIAIVAFTDSSLSQGEKDLSIASISSSTSGKGDTGKITIDATGNLLLDNKGNIFSNINIAAEGNSQGININAKNVILANTSQISTANLGGKGNAGNIEIKALGDVTLIGYTDRFASQLSKAGSSISSGTNGQGDTGKIIIEAKGKLSLDKNSLVQSSIVSPAVGNSKGIDIIAGDLILANTSGILTANLGGIGNAGDLKIETQGVTNIFDNSAIVSSSLGQGKAANISIDSKQLNLNTSGILTNATSVGGGDVTLNLSDLLLLRNNSFINTTSDSTGKNGNGGNITINSPLIVATPGNNDISANAYAGNGGKVNISSQGLFGIQYRPKGQESLFTNDITSSSTFGQNGAVNIDTPGTDPGRDSTELPNTTTDASNQISQVCSANNRQNKLTVTGRGGLPPNANDPLTSDVVWQDARAASSQPAISSATHNPAKLPPPAVGWVFDDKGKVTLIAAGSQAQAGTSVACPQGVGK